MPIPVSGLDQVESWEPGGQILGPGGHVVTIDEADDSGTSSGGYPQIELRMSNNEGNSRDWLVVIPSTYGKIKQLWEAVGVPVPQGDGVLDASKLVGKTVKIQVAKQMDNKGEEKDRVVGYQPAPGRSDVTGPREQASFPGQQAKTADEKLPF